MIIHNATFMVRRDLEADLVGWLKEQLAAMQSEGVARMGEGCNPRVSAMREAGGISHHHADAASVAFQIEFPDIPSAKIWSDRSFTPLAEAFTSRYGEESMAFTSLFEIL